MPGRDGGLRRLVRMYLPDFHWVSIETGAVEPGVPDLEYCRAGATGWVELKAASGWVVDDVRPAQVAWAERRLRAGGRVFVLVRRRADVGVRRAARDEGWLLDGSTLRGLADRAILLDDPRLAVLVSYGGPARWDWQAIGRALVR
jgi:hypothetical protein